MEGSADLRIVLLGKTGAGKSSTGNTILGNYVFTTSSDADSETSKCQAETLTVDGRRITLIDTPGYFSTDRSDEELKPEMAKCITECAPGPHAFLIVLPVRRQTPEEKKVVEEILKMFGDDALKYAVVLFTHGKQLGGKSIDEFVEKSYHLKMLVQKCGQRLHVVDNTEWNNPTAGNKNNDDKNNAVQIKRLLNTIDQMVKQNGGQHYTNKMLQAMERAIEEDMENMKDETEGLLSETTVREKAKQNVLKRFLVQVAGISTGALLGALLGAVAAARLVSMYLPKLGAAKGLGTIAAVGACVGGVVGGAIGSEIAKDAETPTEAVCKVTLAAAQKAQNTIEDTVKALKKSYY